MASSYYKTQLSNNANSIDELTELCKSMIANMKVLEAELNDTRKKYHELLNETSEQAIINSLEPAIHSAPIENHNKIVKKQPVAKHSLVTPINAKNSLVAPINAKNPLVAPINAKNSMCTSISMTEYKAHNSILPDLRVKNISKSDYEYQPKIGANAGKITTGLQIDFIYHTNSMKIKHNKNCIIVIADQVQYDFYVYDKIQKTYVNSDNQTLKALALHVYRKTPINDRMFHDLCIRTMGLVYPKILAAVAAKIEQ